MIQYNEYLQGVSEVTKLGFPDTSDIRIPAEYLDNKQFIIFRTCHSYGDWVLLSAMPRLLKQKYPDCVVAIPSPECLARYFSPNSWMYKHDNPFNNVIEIFKNNTYVDGMIDDIPAGVPLYHDHFRIYNEANPNIPLIKQMLKFWRFEEHEMEDCQPELYWDEEEIKTGDAIIEQTFGKEPFGFLYIDDLFWYHVIERENYEKAKLDHKRSLIQKEINNHNLPWLYYSGNDPFIYKTSNKIVNVKDLKVNLRLQNYIKSKSKLLIGHQGGYGTDCMPRYTNCYVVPLHPERIAEHFAIGTTYLI
jgi:hypothetical protein